MKWILLAAGAVVLLLPAIGWWLVRSSYWGGS